MGTQPIAGEWVETGLQTDRMSRARVSSRPRGVVLIRNTGRSGNRPLRQKTQRPLSLHMRRSALTIAIVLSLGATLMAHTWPHWRGPTRDGVSTETSLPTSWSATENVAWKLPLPAFSGSTPIVWNDTIFL